MPENVQPVKYYYVPVVDTKKETLRFRVKNKPVTYSYKGAWFNGSTAVRTATEFSNLKNNIAKNQGNITSKEANVILKHLANHIHGAKIQSLKPLFELYTDAESEGGTNITQKEQSDILTTLLEWETLSWKKNN